jgi:hypothetical protein
VASVVVVSAGEFVGSFKKPQKAAYSAGLKITASFFPPEELDFFSKFKKKSERKLVADELMPAKMFGVMHDGDFDIGGGGFGVGSRGDFVEVFVGRSGGLSQCQWCWC